MKSVHNGVSVTLSHTSEHSHNHKISTLDYKNSSAIHKLLQTEVEKGYSSCDIAKNLTNSCNGNLDTLKRAGGSNVNWQTA
jgi:hypothetical protein